MYYQYFPLNRNQETTQKSLIKKKYFHKSMTSKKHRRLFFTIIEKLVSQYQRTETSLMAKYKNGTYHGGSFCGVTHIELDFITCEDNIVIPSILQGYVLHWCHKYLLHTGMDRMKAMIHHYLHVPGVRYYVWKEVANCVTFQRKNL